MKRYIGESALFLNTVIWGATFVIIKSALSDISPMLFIALRFSLAALLLLPFSIKILRGIDKETLLGGVLLGVLFFLGFATQTIGLNFTTATKSGFITGSFVIFTPLLQFIIERRPPSKWNLVGTILVITGLAFLSSKGTSFFQVFTEIGSNFNIGDFFTFLCAIFFAMYLVYLDMISKKFDYKPLVFIQIAVTGLGGFIFAVMLSLTGLEAAKLSVDTNVIFAILYTAILATILTTTLQTRFQKVVTPTKAGIIISLEPLFAAVVAYLVLSESVSGFGIIGGIIIFIGLLVTELFDKNKNIE